MNEVVTAPLSSKRHVIIQPGMKRSIEWEWPRVVVVTRLSFVFESETVRWEDKLLVTDFRVGVQSQLKVPTPLPCSVFEIATFQDADAVKPGMLFVLQLHNTAAYSIAVEVEPWGESNL